MGPVCYDAQRFMGTTVQLMPWNSLGGACDAPPGPAVRVRGSSSSNTQLMQQLFQIWGEWHHHCGTLTTSSSDCLRYLWRRCTVLLTNTDVCGILEVLEVLLYNYKMFNSSFKISHKFLTAYPKCPWKDVVSWTNLWSAGCWCGWGTGRCTRWRRQGKGGSSCWNSAPAGCDWWWLLQGGAQLTGRNPGCPSPRPHPSDWWRLHTVGSQGSQPTATFSFPQPYTHWLHIVIFDVDETLPILPVVSTRIFVSQICHLTKYENIEMFLHVYEGQFVPVSGRRRLSPGHDLDSAG